ncbi:hypothetical protein V6Z12_A10G248100 [Gossypium hirsutum]
MDHPFHRKHNLKLTASSPYVEVNPICGFCNKKSTIIVFVALTFCGIAKVVGTNTCLPFTRGILPIGRMITSVMLVVAALMVFLYIDAKLVILMYIMKCALSYQK